MRLNYRRLGSGEPLVLVHGIGSRWQVWQPVLGRLADRHNVVAVDLPGFGASPPPPPGTPAGIDSLAALLLDFLEHELGLDRPHVAGNSLGGWLSLELARRGRVRSATALSPAGFAEGWEGRYGRGSLWLIVRLARALAARAETVMGSTAGRELTLFQLMARPANISPLEASESVRALGGAPWFDDTVRALARESFGDGNGIAVPVTVAWGNKDRILPPRQAKRAARAIPSARMVTLWGCGHVPTYDDPEQVAQVLLDGSQQR
jgi:pimeloyl-ACP methyl ester carboxylesterase